MALFCCIAFVYANADDSLTHNKSNGRHWNALSRNEKIEFVTGYHEGVSACASIQSDFLGADKEAQANIENILGNLKKRFLPLGATYDDVVGYLDNFYAKPDNWDKPIVEVFQLMDVRRSGSGQDSA
jgi:hypothetical protein